jgi:hypothetical protein
MTIRFGMNDNHGSPGDQRPRSDLSQVEGRGKKGNPAFRTICLAAAAKSGLPDFAFRLLAYLLLVHAEPDGGNCFPAQETIGDKLGLAPGWSSKQKLARALSLLRDLGWVEVIPFVLGKGSNTSHLYRFRIPLDLPGDFTHRGMEGALRWTGRPRHFRPKESPESLPNGGPRESGGVRHPENPGGSAPPRVRGPI